jgi:hypothetical protein
MPIVLKSDGLNLQKTSGSVEGLLYLTFARHCDAYQWTPYRYKHPSNSVIFARIRKFSIASAFHATLIFTIAQYKNAYGRCAVLFSLIQLANETCLTNWLRHPRQVRKPRAQYHNKICLEWSPKSAKHFSFQRCFCLIYVGPTYCQIKELHSIAYTTSLRARTKETGHRNATPVSKDHQPVRAG